MINILCIWPRHARDFFQSAGSAPSSRGALGRRQSAERRETNATTNSRMAALLPADLVFRICTADASAADRARLMTTRVKAPAHVTGGWLQDGLSGRTADAILIVYTLMLRTCRAWSAALSEYTYFLEAITIARFPRVLRMLQARPRWGVRWGDVYRAERETLRRFSAISDSTPEPTTRLSDFTFSVELSYNGAKSDSCIPIAAFDFAFQTFDDEFDAILGAAAPRFWPPGQSPLTLHALFPWIEYDDLMLNDPDFEWHTHACPQTAEVYLSLYVSRGIGESHLLYNACSTGPDETRSTLEYDIASCMPTVFDGHVHYCYDTGRHRPTEPFPSRARRAACASVPSNPSPGEPAPYPERPGPIVIPSVSLADGRVALRFCWDTTRQVHEPVPMTHDELLRYLESGLRWGPARGW